MLLPFRALNGLLDIVAPRRCVACELALEPGERGFCEGCALLVDLLQVDVRHPDQAVAAFGGPLQAAVHQLKYHRRSEVAAILGQVMAEAASPLAGEVDAVTAVPLHAARLRQRGYNQSALLARPVARAFGVPLRLGWVRRLRDTPSQTGLDAARRASNVRAAFAADGRCHGRRVLVIDDVRTTGATLTELRCALLAAGAREVRSLCLARAEPPRAGRDGRASGV